MALVDITIDFDLAQILGSDFDPRRTKAYVTTNVESGTLMDTSTGETRLGDEAVTIANDGTGSFTTWAVGADGNPISWQTSLVVDYPRTGQRDRKRRVFGPWTLTAADDGKNITDLEDEQAVPPAYLTTVTELLDTYVDSAQAASTASAAGAQSSAASASLAQTLVTSDLGTTDGQTRALIEDLNSQVSEALADRYIQVGTINVDASNYADLQAAHDTAPTGSVLHLRPGDRTNEALTITKRLTLRGAGGADDGTSAGSTRLISTSATGDLIAVAADGVTIEGVKLINTATTVTAGSGIKVTAGDGAKLRDISSIGFWIGIDIADGVAWSLRDYVIRNFGKYGLRINNTLADGGDQMISDGLFSASSGTRQPDAAIRYESGGGLKFTNSKIIGSTTGANQIDYGLDMAWTGGPSGVLLVSNVSIERIAADAVRLDAGSVGFGFASFANMEIGLIDNIVGSAFKLTKAGTTGLSHVSIDDIVVQQTGGTSTGYVIDATGVDRLVVGQIARASTMAGRLKTTGCTNVTDNSAPSRRAKMVAGRYYGPVGGAPSTAATASNTAAALPYMVPTACLLDRIAVEVTTGIASGTCRLGIYADDNGTPGSLILDAGTVDTSTTGAKEITINQRLDSGLVWLVAVNQTAAATLRAVSGIQAPEGIGALAVADYGTAFTGYYKTGFTGALPATFGTPGGVAGAVARVSVRAA